MHKAAMEACSDDIDLFIYDTTGNITALNEKYYRIYHPRRAFAEFSIHDPYTAIKFRHIYDTPDFIMYAPELAAYFIAITETPPNDSFRRYTDLNGFIKAIKAALTNLGYPTDLSGYPERHFL